MSLPSISEPAGNYVPGAWPPAPSPPLAICATSVVTETCLRCGAMSPTLGWLAFHSCPDAPLSLVDISRKLDALLARLDWIHAPDKGYAEVCAITAVPLGLPPSEEQT